MESNQLRYSYCGMGEIPYKTFLNRKIMKMIIEEKPFSPIHAVIMPTNKCNLSCSFCNCANRDCFEELSMDALTNILNQLQELGTDTITISGGGEPTLYERLDELVLECKKRKMKIGLVTNGIEIETIQNFPVDTFDWIRISCGDGRDIGQMEEILKKSCLLKKKGIVKTIGLSYIATAMFDYELFNNIRNMVDNLEEISYIKLLEDCFSNDFSLKIKDGSEKLIIAQPVFSKVMDSLCCLPLIKPVFSASGYVFPCCDIQYQEDARKYGSERSYCFYTEYKNHVNKQIPYMIPCEGCEKCFHFMHNKYLHLSVRHFEDENWI